MLFKMLYQVALIVLIIAVVLNQAKELDPGPQTFTNSNSSATQNPHKRFATKEVIVYLTPSQIQALESGKAELRTSPDGDTVSPSSNEQKLNPQLLYPHLENLNILNAPFMQELLDNKHQVQHQHGPSHFTPNSYPKNRDETLKLPFFNPDSQSQIPSQSNNVRISGDVQSKWVPVAPVAERHAESYLKEQYQYQHLQNNKAVNKYQIKPHVFHHSAPQLQYASNYDGHYYFSDQENALKQNSNNENQKTLAQVEAIANSLPIVIHKEVQITKHKPVPVVQQVNVPVPTPVFVPILHPYEVKVPQPYPVPFEIIKHVPVPVIRTEKTDVGKLVPYAFNNPNDSYNAHNRLNTDHPFLQGWQH